MIRHLLALLCASTALAASNTPISLAWDASPSPGVIGYNLYIGTNSGSYYEAIMVTNGCSVTVSLPRRPYYFACTAVGLGGMESKYSNEVKWPVQAGTNLVLTVWAQYAPTFAGPWSNSEVRLSVTNPTASMTYWRLQIARTNQ